MNPDLLDMLGTEEQTEDADAKQTENEEGEQKEKPKFDKDVIASLLTADGTDGNFSMELSKEDKEQKKQDEERENADIKIGKAEETIGKYAKDIVADVKKRPDAYTVQTKRGYMTVKDAVKQGYDFSTGDFTRAPLKDRIEEKLAGLGQGDQDIIRNMFDPNNAGIPAVDAEGMGIDPNSPMIAQAPQVMGGQQPQMPTQMQENPQQGLDPAFLQKLQGVKF